MKHDALTKWQSESKGKVGELSASLSRTLGKTLPRTKPICKKSFESSWIVKFDNSRWFKRFFVLLWRWISNGGLFLGNWTYLTYPWGRSLQISSENTYVYLDSVFIFHQDVYIRQQYKHLNRENFWLHQYLSVVCPAKRISMIFMRE